MNLAEDTQHCVGDCDLGSAVHVLANLGLADADDELDLGAVEPKTGLQRAALSERLPHRIRLVF
eukprot:CAMPEP_0204017502 /NCGR_PEP_ID=MMETSP0360-20130528/27450_1 /ASSEMBLY_ACC=CAM_ASM_000342 /TAXON_ID=268821 /ORGANISM="Scrippsiella Hangoei, Strain SHTV-5" /LENGTH=63 /DNA_ID=CAMNT_0050960567 /DNA_START=316 /DNA_END=507 /DNA_ORIENTATION=-